MKLKKEQELKRRTKDAFDHAPFTLVLTEEMIAQQRAKQIENMSESALIRPFRPDACKVWVPGDDTEGFLVIAQKALELCNTNSGRTHVSGEEVLEYELPHVEKMVELGFPVEETVLGVAFINDLFKHYFVPFASSTEPMTLAQYRKVALAPDKKHRSLSDLVFKKKRKK